MDFSEAEMHNGGIKRRKKSRFTTPSIVKMKVVNQLPVKQIALAQNPGVIIIALTPSWPYIIIMLNGLEVPLI